MFSLLPAIRYIAFISLGLPDSLPGSAWPYCGGTFMPPLFSIMAEHIHIAVYPLFLAVFVVLLASMTERVNRLCEWRGRAPKK